MSLPSIAGVQSLIHNLPTRPPIMTKDDLAEFYGTTSSNMMRRVRENIEMFASDVMIELTTEEQQLCRVGTTAERKRTDLAQFGFTETGCLLVALVLRSDRAKEVGPMLIRAFVALREHRAGALKLEVCIDKWAYVGKSTLRQRIMAAADANASYNDLWGRWGYSHRVLTGEIEAMRVRGYIGAMVLTPPLYILREIDAKKAHTAVHVEDTQQLRLGLEG